MQEEVLEENKGELEDVNEEAKIDSEESDSASVYEIGYILTPTISEENLPNEVTRLKDFLLNHNVTFISEDFPKMIELAYEMQRSVENKKQKFFNGYFGWIKFEVEKEETKSIKETLDKDEKIIRYLFIKTSRENTMSSKRSYSRGDSSKRSFSQKTEETVPINEEVLDKEIEALVAE